MVAISAIIPSFNRAEATRAAVLSALAQTYPVAEIIVVDDASQPPFDKALVESLDDRVSVHRLTANVGAAGARQVGIDRARGDVIAFLDSDDVWRPNKLSAQIPLFRANELCAVACGWDEVDETGRGLNIRMPVAAEDPSLFFHGCWFSSGTTVILGRAALERVGPFDSSLRRLEDLDWFARFGMAGGRLAVAPVIGATIKIGARARLETVEAAASHILAKFSASPGLAGADLRALRAWLDVECARAALNEKWLFRATLHLARSFALKPRARVQLRRWWRMEFEAATSPTDFRGPPCHSVAEAVGLAVHTRVHTRRKVGERPSGA